MSDNLVTKESFELYTFYVALKRHFNTDEYDYFAYGGNPGKISPNALASRSDKRHFYSVAHRHRDPKSFVFANILENPNVYIGDIARDREVSDKVFVGWERRMQSLTYLFKEEIGQLDLDFDSNFRCPDGKHPPLLKLFIQKKISLETLTVLDIILGFVSFWDRQMKSDPVWKGISKRVKKYKPFLDIDLPKFKSILKDKFVY